MQAHLTRPNSNGGTKTVRYLGVRYTKIYLCITTYALAPGFYVRSMRNFMLFMTLDNNIETDPSYIFYWFGDKDSQKYVVSSSQVSILTVYNFSRPIRGFKLQQTSCILSSTHIRNTGVRTKDLFCIKRNFKVNYQTQYRNSWLKFTVCNSTAKLMLARNDHTQCFVWMST